ncbi:hypothetical protein D3C75_1002960 [compost metagenome]
MKYINRIKVIGTAYHNLYLCSWLKLFCVLFHPVPPIPVSVVRMPYKLNKIRTIDEQMFNQRMKEPGSLPLIQ